MECCVCLENTKGIYITKCNHYMCLFCLMKLVKQECPYCRQELELPNNFKNKENKSIPDNLLSVLNRIRELSEYNYNHIIESINTGSTYTKEYLDELYYDLFREKVNSSRVRNNFNIDLNL